MNRKLRSAPAQTSPIAPLFVCALVLAGAYAPLASAAARPADADPKLGAAIDAWAKPLVDAGHLSGQLLVARNGRVLVERNFGWANRELGVPMSSETRLNVASITKPMTSLLVLRMIARNKIGYRDSITRWIPDFPRGDSITVEMLLRHRAGIPHEIVPDSEAVRPRTAEEMVERLKHRPLDYAPGTSRGYSSGGYTVLARILELTSGKSYAQLLHDELLGPLGMTHTSHTDGVALLPGRASCYEPGADGIANAAFQDLSGLVGAGSVWSNARDLHRLVQATVNGTLEPEFRQSWVSGGTINWNGRTSGFRAFASWDSASGLEVDFAGNVVTGAPDLLRDAVVALVMGRAPVRTQLPAIADHADPALLASCTGRFQLGNGTKLDLHVRGGVLWANDWILQPMEGGGFFSPRDYGRIRPVAGADGKVERLDWEQAGQVYPAPRIAAGD